MVDAFFASRLACLQPSKSEPSLILQMYAVVHVCTGCSTFRKACCDDGACLRFAARAVLSRRVFRLWPFVFVVHLVQARTKHRQHRKQCNQKTASQNTASPKNSHQCADVRKNSGTTKHRQRRKFASMRRCKKKAASQSTASTENLHQRADVKKKTASQNTASADNSHQCDVVKHQRHYKAPPAPKKGTNALISKISGITKHRQQRKKAPMRRCQKKRHYKAPPVLTKKHKCAAKTTNKKTKTKNKVFQIQQNNMKTLCFVG